ncbi:MAG: ADP-ribosylation factor-like protein 2 [Olpidium bornovanus]|uniref:ADP-ribosylation factor-like protein 2 n=1 Tax=Olpidium bornovanus TaxID=278681 RepID=A0A8H8DH35_9FUNG|nr:MAG: ADP-ribosylation factor-like protein 2 [Olpidium bornovanus]
MVGSRPLVPGRKQDALAERGLLSVLRKNRRKEREIRLLMFSDPAAVFFFRNLRGLDNAGKTTILKRVNGEDVTSVSPTLGFNIKTLEHRGSVRKRRESCAGGLFLFLSRPFWEYKLNIWDVGGQKSIRSYWRNYFEQTDGLVWVVDSADRMRLPDCEKELKELLKEEVGPPPGGASRLAGASLLVFANKQDLPGALSDAELRDALGLQSIKTHHWSIQACSAVTGENLVQGMDWIADDIGARIFLLD